VSDDLVQKTIYYDMDEFLVNLNNPGNQVSFLKTIITLELPNQASLNEVQSQMPRIRDTFQIYLRELRNSDLQGSAGLQRLRTELLLRINNILEDGTVNNILFKEILVQ
jgi:flagellar FliL protein